MNMRLQHHYLTTIITLGIFGATSVVAAPAAAAETGEYGSAFEEMGFHDAGDYFSPGDQVHVNKFGGNLIISARDIDVPSIGDYSLFFQRTHNSGGGIVNNNPTSSLRESDGPLGVGWTSHYGLLKVAQNGRPEFVDGTGAREIFYRHNASNLSSLRLGDEQDTWISQSLNILYRETPTRWYLFKANGTRYTFDFVVTGKFVPTTIEDKAGNEWDISYEDNWTADYPNHPIIERITDDTNRYLQFSYTTVGQKPRISSIRLNGSTTKARYTYTTSGGLVYLQQHKTAQYRTTSYSYYTSNGYKKGVITSLTHPNGGDWDFSFSKKKFHYRGGTGYSEVLAVTSIDKGNDTWSYSYPSQSQSNNNYTVSVLGPNGFSGNYTYYTYQNGTCSYTTLSKIGLLVSSTESRNGTSTSRQLTYENNPLKISDDSYSTECFTDAVYKHRLTRETQTQDGHTLTTDYSDYDLLLPQQIDRPGNIRDTRDYTKRYTGNEQYSVYILGLPTLESTTKSGTTVQKTVYGNYQNDGLPRYIKRYKTSRYNRKLCLAWI